MKQERKKNGALEGGKISEASGRELVFVMRETMKLKLIVVLSDADALYVFYIVSSRGRR